MKIKICRASGNPIRFEDQDLFAADYRILYDKVVVKLGMDGLITEEKAARATKLLDRASRTLRAKYPLIGDVQFPKSAKAWLKLVIQHGPVALAKSSNGGKLTIVIMDSAFGGD